ncbi:MAG: hypothetical protein AAF039_18975 [Bacteroidota bacterium]
MTSQEREGLDSKIKASSSKDFSEWARRALLNGHVVSADPLLVIKEIGELRELSKTVSGNMDEIVSQISAGAYSDSTVESNLIEHIDRYLELKEEMIEAVRRLYRGG